MISYRIAVSIVLLFIPILSFSQNEKQEVIDTAKRKENVNLLRESKIFSKISTTDKGNTYLYDALKAESTISIIGEPDVLRHMSSFPGVSQGLEGTLGLFVRGGNSGNNGLFFNDVPLYVSSHLVGIVSIYPPSIIDKTVFKMGAIPSYRGNLSSSLLDVSIKKDYGKKFNGKLSLSPYLNGLYSSIPLKNNKISLQIAGRTSFAPFILNKFAEDDEKIKLDIYDFAASLNYKMSDETSIEAFFFSTNDYLKSNSNSLTQNWRENIYKIGWQYYPNSKLNFKAWVYYNSFYCAQITTERNSNNDLENLLGLSSGIKESSLNAIAKYSINTKLVSNFGLSCQLQSFTPGNRMVLEGEESDSYIKNINNNLFNIFGELDYSPFRWLDFNLGYRHILQKSENKVLSNFDFHSLIHIILRNNFGLEFTYDRLTQTYHAVEGLPIGWAMNMMLPSTQNRPSEFTRQFYGGTFYQKSSKNMGFKGSLGCYYRSINNIVSYINPTNAFELDISESELDIGSGTSYGLELAVSLDATNFTTSLSYTLSKTDRKFPNINKGKRFPFKFDRRHILNLHSKYIFKKGHSKRGKLKEHAVSGVMSYSTGNRVTVPLGYYEGVMPPYWSQIYSGILFPDMFYHQIYDRQLMSDKNAIKMKDYLRFDFAYSFKLTSKKTVNEFSFSIFNVLNRRNPYMYFREDGSWKQLSIVPIMPSIRWSLSW